MPIPAPGFADAANQTTLLAVKAKTDLVPADIAARISTDIPETRNKIRLLGRSINDTAIDEVEGAAVDWGIWASPNPAVCSEGSGTLLICGINAAGEKIITTIATTNLTQRIIFLLLRGGSGGAPNTRFLRLIGGVTNEYAVPSDSIWRHYVIYLSGAKKIIIEQDGVVVFKGFDDAPTVTVRLAVNGDGGTTISLGYIRTALV